MYWWIDWNTRCQAILIRKVVSRRVIGTCQLKKYEYTKANSKTVCLKGENKKYPQADVEIGIVGLFYEFLILLKYENDQGSGSVKCTKYVENECKMKCTKYVEFECVHTYCSLCSEVIFM